MAIISICLILLVLILGFIAYLLYTFLQRVSNLKIDGIETLKRFLNKFGEFKKPMILETELHDEETKIEDNDYIY